MGAVKRGKEIAGSNQRAGKKKRSTGSEPAGEPCFDDIDAILLGKLGYKPWELHRLSFRDVALSIDGLYEQNKYVHDLLQLSTRLIVFSGFNAKAALQAFNKAWPVEGRKGTAQISEAAMNQLRQLREADAKQRAKKTLDARKSEITG